jgi:hypothetical protein
MTTLLRETLDHPTIYSTLARIVSVNDLTAFEKLHCGAAKRLFLSHRPGSL